MSEADRAGRRWVVLVAGTLAMTAGCTFQYGLAYLIPAFRAEGLSLEQASILVACPPPGCCSPWSPGARRRTGGASGWCSGPGWRWPGPSCWRPARSMGWARSGPAWRWPGRRARQCTRRAAGSSWARSPGRQRGLAMGIRQSAQPLGIMVAALVLPALGAVSRAAGLLFLGAFCLAAALLVAAAVRDPARRPRPPRAASPARRTGAGRAGCCGGSRGQRAARRAAVRGLHVRAGVPGQPARAGRHHGAAARGGAACGAPPARRRGLVRPGGQQAAPDAAAGRGHRADHRGAGEGAAVRAPWAAGVLLVAVVLAVSTNGLSFTSVAEHAGRRWAGRALGVQNTGQNALAAATPPALAAVIGAAGYPAAFGIVVLFPLAAGGPAAGARGSGTTSPRRAR